MTPKINERHSGHLHFINFKWCWLEQLLHRQTCPQGLHTWLTSCSIHTTHILVWAFSLDLFVVPKTTCSQPFCWCLSVNLFGSMFGGGVSSLSQSHPSKSHKRFSPFSKIVIINWRQRSEGLSCTKSIGRRPWPFGIIKDSGLAKIKLEMHSILNGLLQNEHAKWIGKLPSAVFVNAALGAAASRNFTTYDADRNISDRISKIVVKSTDLQNY